MFWPIPVLWRLRPNRPVALVLAVMGLVVVLAWLSVALPAVALPVAAAPRSKAVAAPGLPALGLAADALTVSGLSSGAYMAGQFQVAYSGSVAGAALLAGGPYGCARGAVTTAMYNCSCPANPDALQRWRNLLPGLGCAVLPPAVLAVYADAALAANRADIDDPRHLAAQRVWLFSGGHDEVVRPALVDAAEAFYRRQGVADARLHRERVADAGHGLPAPDAPVVCSRTATPYLNRCPGQDAAGELLAWLYGSQPTDALLPPLAPRAGGLRPFSQVPYRKAGVFDGLDDSGWLYVPAACEPGAAAAGATPTAAATAATPTTPTTAAEPRCRLHVVFHGCQQGQRAAGPGGRPIGRQFVDGAGYNRWAEANRIVLLYPQVLASSPARAGRTYQLNPEGCWDFWGYTDAQESLASPPQRYANRSAPQLRAVKAMVDALLRPVR